MICVGVDVAKEKSVICLMKPCGEVIRMPFELKHIDDEINNFIEYLSTIDEEKRIVMEATGVYHLPMLFRLKDSGFFVSVVNPLVMKKYMSISLRKAKTDKIDSARIANYGLDYWQDLIEYQYSDEAYDELKILGRQYSHYVKVKISSKLALDKQLSRIMPGTKALIQDRTDDFTKNKLGDFVEKYQHYDNITKMKEENFVDSYCKWAKKKGYHANADKAHKIYAAAQAGIPTLPSTRPSTKMLTLEAVRVLKEINKTLQLIISQMQEIARGLKEYCMVRAMPGVGDILSVRLIAEIGDIRKFHSGSALVAYSGIDAPPYESGGFVGTQRKISKRGSSTLRKVGYEIMKCLKSAKPTYDAVVYEYMMKKESEGKAKKVAKIAALNKFLRIYYARVKEIYAE